MPSPFPGFDPYLEHPDFWPEVHSRLIVALADSLVPQVRPKYEIAIEKRIYEINPSNGDNSLILLSQINQRCSFYIGIHGYEEVESLTLFHEQTAQLMSLSPHKRPDYQRGRRAQMLIQSTFEL